MSKNKNQGFYDWIESIQPLINFGLNANRQQVIKTFADTSFIKDEHNALDSLDTEIDNLNRYKNWLKDQLSDTSMAAERLEKFKSNIASTVIAEMRSRKP